VTKSNEVHIVLKKMQHEVRDTKNRP